MAEIQEIKRLRLTAASYAHHYGPDDPRTTAAARELAEARARIAEAEAIRLRAIADELSAVAS
jgi:hypothetical protein